jgi:hypothetical protein
MGSAIASDFRASAGSPTALTNVRTGLSAGAILEWRALAPWTISNVLSDRDRRCRAWNRDLRLHVNLVQVAAGASVVQSRIETYRAKAKEFARLILVAKSLRDSRQYRKLAEMYWALALGEEPEDARPSETHLKGTRHDHLSGRVSQTFGAEVDESH